jgi:hypothetical protein
MIGGRKKKTIRTAISVAFWPFGMGMLESRHPFFRSKVPVIPFEKLEIAKMVGVS